jgi:hypothetical protein
VHHSGDVGQEIRSTIAWTTDEWTDQVTRKLLNKNEELLPGRSGKGSIPLKYGHAGCK